MKRLFMTMATIAIMSISVNAQSKQTAEEALQSKKATEFVIGYVNGTMDGGKEYDKYESVWSDLCDCIVYDYKERVNAVRNPSWNEVFNNLNNRAKTKYGKDYPNFILRNMDMEYNSYEEKSSNYRRNITSYSIEISACVVYDAKDAAYERLPIVIDKVMSTVRDGSRLAIDQVFVWSDMNKEDFKDMIIDNLLEKGYKVVAKEYLEKLYEEQLNQQSEIYNENTKVKENNFSAIGYYLNINVTDTFIKAQLVNVSTGEFDGYVFENLNPVDSKTKEVNDNLSKALDKGLNNIRMNSRVAIDGIYVPNGTSKEFYKDQIINSLLDKGYKVVAKEYLEKLYEEQQSQQSGIYNEKTTVQENNFSAVGYYINVKVTETSLRVQVINVSTGEYEGNATVNF